MDNGKTWSMSVGGSKSMLHNKNTCICIGSKIQLTKINDQGPEKPKSLVKHKEWFPREDNRFYRTIIRDALCRTGVITKMACETRQIGHCHF